MDDDEEDSGGAGWIVSYADLMTLLFATFVVLYGLKPEGETKAFLGVASSIREAFMEVPDDIPLVSKYGPIIKGKDIFKFWRGDADHKPIVKKYNRTEYALNIINKDFDTVRNVVDSVRKKMDTGSDGSKATTTSPITVIKSGDFIQIRLMSSVFYTPGTYRLKRKAIRELAPLVETLINTERKIHIAGHTDNIPVDGEFSNWEISSLRASFMARYFIDYYDFPPGRISAGGYADTKPIFSNETPEGRDGNRRVELMVKYDDVAEE